MGRWVAVLLLGTMACTGGSEAAPPGEQAEGAAEAAPPAPAATSGGAPPTTPSGGMASHQHRPGMIHEAGSHVMPFSLEETLHVFEMTVDGGIQDVVVREGGGPEQIDLIRGHLREQAERFARGDFGDPASIHGGDMPGLLELSAGAEGLEVIYSDLPDGGRIRYSSGDPVLVTAIHRWFGAQLSDHGTDATYR
jgi:hypothetical protein